MKCGGTLRYVKNNGGCVSCVNASISARRKTPQGQAARAAERRRYRYGLTVEQVNAMLAAQSGACKICRRVPAKPLHVDHCHATGHVRGLLCQTCNITLGKFRDDPGRFRAAATYLETAAIEALL